MDFREIKFVKAKPDDEQIESLPKELRDLDYPWFEGEIPRLIFQDSVVQIVFMEDYFDDYTVEGIDPPNAKARVTASVEVTGKLNEFHEGAYNNFIENPGSYEKRIRDYLLAKIEMNLTRAIAFSDTPKLRPFIKKFGLNTPAGLNKQIEWTGITLYDHGWDSIGFITMDFKCGWDEEHGISILMHRNKIIAEGGLGEFSNCGTGLIETAKYTQSYATGYDVALQ
jgi:hypothetical protein